MGKLTDSKIRNLKAENAPSKIFDGGGLYLKDGKYWRWKYYFQGKEQLLSLGTYPETSLAKAREKHQKGRALLSEGFNPSVQRKIEKLTRHLSEKSSFKPIALEWFNQKMTDKDVSHQKRQMRILEKDLFPSLGNRPVDKISALELTALLHKIQKRSVDMAHRARQVIRQVLSYAVATGRADHNPARDLDVLKPLRQTHLPAIIDTKHLGELLNAIDNFKGTIVTKKLMQISALVFQRPGEVRKMEWSEIDFSKQQWSIPASKMKMKRDHIVPLSSQSLTIFNELWGITGKGKYVFPSARANGKPASDNGARKALRTMGYPKEVMTPHGFRATARTLLDEELHFPVDVIEHQLSHAVRDATGRAYNRTSHIRERTKMMQVWADFLDVIKNPPITSQGGKRSGSGRKKSITHRKKIALANEVTLLQRDNPNLSISEAIRVLQKQRLVRPQNVSRYLTPGYLEVEITKALKQAGRAGILSLAPRLTLTNPF